MFCEIIERLDKLEYSELLVEEILDLAQQAMMLKKSTEKWQIRDALEHAKNLGIKRERITEILAMGTRRKLRENMKTFQESVNSLEIMSLTQQLKADTELPFGTLDKNLDF